MEPWRRLDTAAVDEARALLQQCCGSREWVERMSARRPFGSRDAMLQAARDEWLSLTPEDWLEAFSHHPRIGDRESRRRRFATTAHLAEREQAGVEHATADVLSALASRNDSYERKFGFIFIVCATGKTADEMLRLLERRLPHSQDVELRVAAEEQAKITELRLLAI